MTFTEFQHFISQHDHPIILLEGRRNIDPQHAQRAKEVATLLAKTFPHARFRSGNAPGSDDAFSAGVAVVDPSRLELVAPNDTHRMRSRIQGATYTSPAALSPSEREKLIAATIAASPGNKNLFLDANLPRHLKAKAAYLLRNTQKVHGAQGLTQVDAALFYIDPANPHKGGTGHTIRVCQSLQIPIIFQQHWQHWE